MNKLPVTSLSLYFAKVETTELLIFFNLHGISQGEDLSPILFIMAVKN